MSLDGDAPGTIVLIHGLWLTPRSWERWVARYTSRGFRLLAPPWPGMEAEVEASNVDPSPIPAHRRPIVDHYEDIVLGLVRTAAGERGAAGAAPVAACRPQRAVSTKVICAASACGRET